MQKLYNVLSNADPAFKNLSESEKQKVVKQLSNSPQALKKVLQNVDPAFNSLPTKEQHKALGSLTEKGFIAKGLNALKVGTGEAMELVGNLSKHNDQIMGLKNAPNPAGGLLQNLGQKVAYQSPSDKLKYTPSELNHSPAGMVVQNFALDAIKQTPEFMLVNSVGGPLARGALGLAGKGLLKTAPNLVVTAEKAPALLKAIGKGSATGSLEGLVYGGVTGEDPITTARDFGLIGGIGGGLGHGLKAAREQAAQRLAKNMANKISIVDGLPLLKGEAKSAPVPYNQAEIDSLLVNRVLRNDVDSLGVNLVKQGLLPELQGPKNRTNSQSQLIESIRQELGLNQGAKIKVAQPEKIKSPTVNNNKSVMEESPREYQTFDDMYPYRKNDFQKGKVNEIPAAIQSPANKISAPSGKAPSIEEARIELGEKEPLTAAEKTLAKMAESKGIDATTLADRFSTQQNAIKKQYIEALKSEGFQGVEKRTRYRDPQTGEEIYNPGFSKNPQWYRDFYEANGRAPKESDLNYIADEHLRRGFIDESGEFIPPNQDYLKLDHYIKTSEKLKSKLGTYEDNFDLGNDLVQELRQVKPQVKVKNDLSLVQKPRTLTHPTTKEPLKVVDESYPNYLVVENPKGQRFKVKRQENQVKVNNLNREEMQSLLTPPKKEPPLEKIQKEAANQTAEFVVQNQQQQGNSKIKASIRGSDVVDRNIPTPEWNGKTTDRKSAFNALRAIATIRTGRLGRVSEAVQGWFNTHSEVSRIRNYGDIRTITHELGHYLDQALGLNDASYHGELTRYATRALNPSPENNRAEGIAEFVATYLINGKEAAKRFPGFYKHFESKLADNPQIMNRVKIAQDKVHTWFSQDATERVKGSIVFEKEKKASVKEIASKAYEEFIDKQAGLDRVAREWEKITGKKLKSKDDPFKLAQIASHASGIAEDIIYHGSASDAPRSIWQSIGRAITRRKSKDDIRGIIPILKDIGPKRYKDFATYCMAWNVKDEIQLGRVTPIVLKEANSTIVKFEKEFEPFRQEVMSFNKYVLGILADNGIISKQSYIKMLKQRPNYMPQERDFDDKALTEGLFGSKSFINLTQPLKKRNEHGSLYSYKDPFKAIMKHVYSYTSIAEQNKVGLALTKLGKEKGMGWIAEPVPGGASAKDSTFFVYENGEKVVFQTTPEIYEIMKNANERSMKFLTDVIGGATKTLKAGTTTYNLPFAIVDAPRNTIASLVYSKHWINPFNVFSGICHALGKTQLYHEVKRAGVNFGINSVDKTYFQDAYIGKLIKQSQRKINPLKAISDIVEAVDAGARIAEYRKAKAKTGSQEEAAFDALDLTVDFLRSGRTGQHINRIDAFFNVFFQGADKDLRTVKEMLRNNSRAMQVATNATLYLGLPTVVCWALNKGNRAYEEAEEYQKNLYWSVPTRFGAHARIAVPQEMVKYKVFLEELLNAADGKDLNFSRALKASIGGFTPPMTINLFAPLIENVANYSFFRGRNIVPLSEIGLKPYAQAGPYQTDISKDLAKVANNIKIPGLAPDGIQLSPRKMENATRGYFGGLGTDVLRTADSIYKAGKRMAGKEVPQSPSGKLLESWPIKSAWVTDYNSSQSIQDLYDKYKKLDSTYKTYKDTGEKLGKDFSMMDYHRLKKAVKKLGNIRKSEEAIHKSVNLTGKEKRDRLDKLNIIKINIARNALGRELIKK